MGIATAVDMAGKWTQREVYSEKTIGFEIPYKDKIFHPFDLSSGYGEIRNQSKNIFGFSVADSYSYQYDFEMSPDDKAYVTFRKMYTGVSGGEDIFEINEVLWLDRTDTGLPNRETNDMVLKIDNSGEKFSLGITQFITRKFAFPKNVVFYANFVNAYQSHWKEKVIISDNVKFPIELKNDIVVSLCHWVYFDNAGNLRCYLSQESIDEFLKNKDKSIPESEIDYVIQD